MIGNEHRRKSLEASGKELRRRMRISLARQGKNTSGQLSKSIEYNVMSRRGDLALELSAAEYADFVNKGVRGAKRSPFPGQRQSPYSFKRGKQSVPRNVIDRWVVRKGLAGTRDDQGRFISRQSMVFLIARAIHERGLKPSFFIDRTFERMEKHIVRDYNDAYERDIQDYLDGLE